MTKQILHSAFRRKKRGIGQKSLMSRFPATIKIAAAASLLALPLQLSSCRDKSEAPGAVDVLVSMGDSVLTVSDVERKIPVGISASDSVALFRKIVDNWIEGTVLYDMAKTKLPEIEKIEEQVANYRKRLIVAEYLKKMREGKEFKISPDSVRAFYDSHKSEMVSETPLVKGIYLKVPDASAGIEEMKKCVYDASGASIDKLEKNWIGEALQYDYFENKWVDWSIIADQIPYRFFDPDAFLSSTKNFETSCNGSTYILHISDYLPSGSEIPFEFASTRISNMLEQAKMASYEEALVSALIKKAMSEGRLVAVGYDPLRGIPADRDKIKEKKDLKDEE